MTTTKTLPFSGVTRAQLTDSLVEGARKQARARGLKQFAFRDTRDSAYHTVIVTDGGTIENPTGGRSDNAGLGYYS